MSTAINDDPESIDQKTSRSICDAVGARLQQNLHPETGLSAPLQALLDELHRHDGDPPSGDGVPQGSAGARFHR